ncbi:MAG: malto-oligosyltrehalose trehalohydrolase [Xanthobacteraceae bacterium]|nr:malto-oligosyltrehalose trehalohydrolase [Xanthobacteraceae bacterium]
MSCLHFGPELTSAGVQFRLWAPAAKHVELVLERPVRMEPQEDGWHTLMVPEARTGTRYRFRIDSELDVPDPASAFQPDDVSGPSEVIDHAAHIWRAADWRGRPWESAAILELHVGTFTPGGTFRAAIDKLDHVVDAGFTAIELMPVADFSGHRNWGYDGVLLFAPDSAYGRPEDLKALIDAAHLRGLMVLLDVVYNHFGPEGNYLGRYAPQFFTAARTPWGNAIDYRVPQVRGFAIENALHWITNYRFDGLRLDAVHAITQAGEPPLLADLSRAVGARAQELGRQVHLVLENDDNRASLLDPRTDPPRGKYRAQWNDDYHHAWHVKLTGETHGYYTDYREQPLRQIARVLSSGFVYQGEASAHRKGEHRGEPSGKLPPEAFITFLQNHDQIGNRPFGDRLTKQTDPHAIEAALAVMLLAPMPPLMFMGEEWGATTPFPFFCDFTGELAEAVRTGRRKEFKDAYAAHADEVPDPLSEETFRSAVLNWSACREPDGRRRLDLVRELLSVRRQEIVPRVAQSSFASATADGDLLEATWSIGRAETLALLANLGGSSIGNPRPRTSARPIWGGPAPPRLRPWSVFWAIGAP